MMLLSSTVNNGINPRVDRRTIVGLSIVLGLISAAAMAYVGLRAFNKVKSRVIHAVSREYLTI